jgi:hypothetical protein
LKEYLKKNVIMAIPNLNKSFDIYSDASEGAIVTALEKYWYYIKGSPLTVYIDHKPLLNYLSRKGNDLIDRESRWWEKMRRLDLTIKYIEAKENIVASYSESTSVLKLVFFGLIIQEHREGRLLLNWLFL